jgi:aryl-alcohol dehydrogenase-like predicted oxidoreductase
MVKTLPFSDISVPSPGFGVMGFSHGYGYNMTMEEAEPTLSKALELGSTFWDTAVSKKHYTYNQYTGLNPRL